MVNIVKQKDLQNTIGLHFIGFEFLPGLRTETDLGIGFAIKFKATEDLELKLEKLWIVFGGMSMCHQSYIYEKVPIIK